MRGYNLTAHIPGIHGFKNAISDEFLRDLPAGSGAVVMLLVAARTIAQPRQAPLGVIGREQTK